MNFLILNRITIHGLKDMTRVKVPIGMVADQEFETVLKLRSEFKPCLIFKFGINPDFNFLRNLD
jgi:hypothetical protein